MKQAKHTYPLRLPHSVKAEVERRAKADGISINQFVATAVAEKLAVMDTAAFFAERRARADFKAFDRLMRRKGGEPPSPDDAIGDPPSRG
ncbi:MAG: toxin-antitoxin system HicB family antitoxin [Acetobacteraceae bacterium]